MYPDARWRIFQEEQAEDIYLNDEFVPSAKQPNAAKARSWYNNMVSKKFGDESKNISKRQRQRQRKLEKNAVEKLQEDSNVALSDQGGNWQAAEGEIQTLFNAQEDSTAPEGSIAQADYPPSEADQRENYQTAVHSNVCQQDSPTSEQGQGDSIRAKTEGTNMAQAGSRSSEKGQAGDEQGQTSSKDQPNSAVANQFLQFLRMFRDDDEVLYFEGVVAGMKHTGSPKFRVPYDFIRTHNNELAITICESYPRISDELTESVCIYLKGNGVDIAPKLVIEYLPEAKSEQIHEFCREYRIG